MRRLDHTMIFFLIAGTVTPFALLVMERPLATALLIAVWSGALAGTIVELVWVEHPKWVSAIVYIAVGMIGAIGFPAIVAEAGIVAGLLIAGGGALYATGAIVYAAQRPDPSPAVFGYHEIFHVLVIAAAAAHFAAIALFAVPRLSAATISPARVGVTRVAEPGLRRTGSGPAGRGAQAELAVAGPGVARCAGRPSGPAC